MDRYYKIGMAFGLWLLAVGVSKADDYKTNTFNPVEHAVISQTIAPDARAAGMGDVGAATDPDVNSQHWNLAKYPFCISRAGVSLNYTPWLRQLVNDIDLAYVTGYYRVGDYGALSGSLRYFSLGTVYTDGAGEDESSTVKPYEMALDVAYSRMLSDHFSLGVGLRWIYSDLRYDYSEDSKPASAFSADIAMYYNNYVMLGSRECQLGFGATVTNIGSKISYYGDEIYEESHLTITANVSGTLPVATTPAKTPTQSKTVNKVKTTKKKKAQLKACWRLKERKRYSTQTKNHTRQRLRIKKKLSRAIQQRSEYITRTRQNLRKLKKSSQQLKS